MRYCERCEIKHSGTFGSGRFCSRGCANSHKRTDDSRKKTQQANQRYWQSLSKKEQTEQLKRTIQDPEAKARRLKNLFDKKWEDVCYGTKRKRVIIEQKNMCAECGIYEWRKRPISLQVDHIDGNNNNDLRENLTALCPNCHTQTSTWGSKNKQNSISDDELLSALRRHKNINQAFLSLGVKARGERYERAKRLMKSFNL